MKEKWYVMVMHEGESSQLGGAFQSKEAATSRMNRFLGPEGMKISQERGCEPGTGISTDGYPVMVTHYGRKALELLRARRANEISEDSFLRQMLPYIQHLMKGA